MEVLPKFLVIGPESEISDDLEIVTTEEDLSSAVSGAETAADDGFTEEPFSVGVYQLVGIATARPSGAPEVKYRKVED